LAFKFCVFLEFKLRTVEVHEVQRVEWKFDSSFGCPQLIIRNESMLHVVLIIWWLHETFFYILCHMGWMLSQFAWLIFFYKSFSHAFLCTWDIDTKMAIFFYTESNGAQFFFCLNRLLVSLLHFTMKCIIVNLLLVIPDCLWSITQCICNLRTNIFLLLHNRYAKDECRLRRVARIKSKEISSSWTRCATKRSKRVAPHSLN
jgi:hypothetical protein